MGEMQLKNRKLNIEKLLRFGFAPVDGGYAYTRTLVEGQMRLDVRITPDGVIATRVTDTADGEEYVLHRVRGVAGAFVGQVKAEYDALLDEIAERCYEPDVFQTAQAREILAYAREKYGDEPEYLWKKFPDNAVLRRQDTKKWYAALLTVSRRKLGFDSDESAEILDLRIRPEEMAALLDGARYLPGYHMNKKHWYTIVLDGGVPTAEICRRMDESYALAVK